MENDYKKLGFRCGLEIHQQLDTGKLFCSCPSIVNDPAKPDIRIKRKLRPVVGETGEIDKAALHEMKKGREYIYEACSSSSCLVELDEEPPHQMNRMALEAAVQAAKLLNAKVLDEIQVMRKTVIDGSNVSGFQRTALIAINGFIETEHGRVSIPTVCLEEEAAKKIKDDEKSATYRLDRLGVPLIEVSTGTDIINPEHAKEAASKIGMILRSTGKAKRGIGTIRQDVNISIKNHPRVEIKGFQDLKSMPRIIDYEIKRQIKYQKKAEPHVRKAEPDMTTSFLRPMPGSARMYPETDVLPVKAKGIEGGNVELIEDRIINLEKAGINKEIAAIAVKQGKEELLINSVSGFKSIKPAFIAELICTAAKQVKKQFGKDVNPSDEDITTLLKELESGKIAKESVLEILSKGKPVKDIIKEYELMPDSELEKELKKIAEENKGLAFNALIGKAMAKLRGKASGQKIAEMLKKVAE